VDIDENITNIIGEAKQISIKYIVEQNLSDKEFNCEKAIRDDGDDEVDIFRLTEISRYSCACHKLNIVFSKAISNHDNFSQKLDELQKFAIKCKSNLTFASQRCSPKLMNATRWFSQFNTILWAKKAYEKGLFDNLDCPFLEKELDILIQILSPAYNINFSMQRTESWIGDVLPYVLFLKTTWSRQILEDEPRELCYFLISHLFKKFETELNSNIYKVR